MPDLSHPPSHPVKWRFRHKPTHQSTEIVPDDPIVTAQSWFKARQLAASSLGVPVSEVEAVLESEC